MDAGPGTRGTRRLWDLPLLALTMVVAVAARLVWIPLGSGTARFANVDTASYRSFAAALPGALGDPPPSVLDASLQRSPGYPLLVWLTGAATGSPTALLVVQCLIGGVVVVGLTHRLGRGIAGRRAAVVAAAVVALDPASIGHSLLIGTETLFTAVTLGALVLLWIARERAAEGRAVGSARVGGAMAAAGALLGVATLVRPQAVYLVPVAATGAGVLVATRRPDGACARPRWLQAVAGGAVVLLAATVVGGPWLVRNRVVADRWVVSTAQGQNLADIGAACMEAERSGVAWWPEPEEASFARQDRARERFEARYGRAVALDDVVARDAAWSAAGRRAVAAHPWGCAQVLGSSLVRAAIGPADSLLAALAGPDAPTPLRRVLRATAVAAVVVELAAAATGAAVLARRRRWGALGVLAVPILAYLLSSAGPQLYARFRVPVVPYLAVLAAVGLVAVRDRRSVARPRRDASGGRP